MIYFVGDSAEDIFTYFKLQEKGKIKYDEVVQHFTDHFQSKETLFLKEQSLIKKFNLRENLLLILE